MENQLKPITVSSIIKAPSNTVWDCWTGPEHIVKWYNASDDWHAPSAQNDLRPGGEFSTRMEAKDGSAGFDFEGVYDAVEPGKAIAYTLGDGRKVAIRFTEVEQGTQVEETFDPENMNPVEMQRDGWQAILDNFKKYAEAQ